MKIGIISGSHRNNSESEKVARHIEKELVAQGVCDETWLYSLAGNPLPLWDEGIWSGDEQWQRQAVHHAKRGQSHRGPVQPAGRAARILYH